MKVKKSVLALSSMDFIFTKVSVEEGRVKGVVIVYYTEINGRAFQICRIDMSHGYLHKDLLFEKPKAKIKIKKEISGKTVSELRQEIIENWESYREKFFENWMRGAENEKK